MGTLEAEFDQLMADKLGVSDAKLPVNNAASCTMLTSSLDDRARELVRAVYAQDFKLFGYSTEVPEDAFGFLDRAEVAEIDRELPAGAPLRTGTRVEYLVAVHNSNCASAPATPRRRRLT